MENQEKKDSHIGWYLFIGFMFVGMGIGDLFDKGGVGTMVGMGVGFLASAIYKSDRK